jgi:hypothetical protein
LNDWPEGYNLIWDRFTQISSIGVGRLIAHDDVYPVISNLYSAASAAVIQAKSDRAQGKELSHQEPWRALVGGLKAEWTGVGGKATAAKSGRGRYANPSEFVRLVWAIMRYAIPAELREHTASEGAMQTAVSEALRPRRCRDNSSKKPLRKNPAKR